MTHYGFFANSPGLASIPGFARARTQSQVAPFGFFERLVYRVRDIRHFTLDWTFRSSLLRSTRLPRREVLVDLSIDRADANCHGTSAEHDTIA